LYASYPELFIQGKTDRHWTKKFTLELPFATKASAAKFSKAEMGSEVIQGDDGITMNSPLFKNLALSSAALSGSSL
jgi:hypothetical protein